MKIGFVRRGFSETGGLEIHLTRFARVLVEAGHECVLFTTGQWPINQWPYGRLSRVTGDEPVSFADGLSAMRSRLDCDVLFSWERIWSCDIYRAGEGVHRGWLERRRKYDQDERTRWMHAWHPYHRQLLQLEEKLFTPEAAGYVIAPSSMVKREIIQYYGYPEGRIEVVYNGIPPESFQCSPGWRQETRKKLGLTESTLAILFAGSGWERKGLRFAIQGVEGMKREKPVLLVAGQGDKSEYVSKRVRFLGPVSEMRPFYAAADLFLLPTLYDPFSIACLEAMAQGLPVITTEQSGFSELIESGKEGEVLRDPGDYRAITEAIERWADPERRQRVRPRLIRLASRFSISENMERFLEIVRHMPSLEVKI